MIEEKSVDSPIKRSTRIGSVQSYSDLDPGASVDVHLLHQVVDDGRAAVVLGLLPGQLAAVLVDVGHLERTLRRRRLVCGHGERGG